MEHASTNGQAGLAFSSEELSLLRRRVEQRLNGELFDTEVILRLLATIEQNVQNDRAPTIMPKRSNATVRKRDLQRELATKEAEIAHLRSALARIAKVAGQAAGEIEDQARNNGSLTLPPMQRLVLEEACKGKTTREIAEELHRSKHTISNHIKMVMKTLGVRTRSALIAQTLHQRSRT
jgi:DNA-binding NarL/FixJ family response regulator